MGLDNILLHNFEFLVNLKKDDKCKVVNDKMEVDNDNFQDINSSNIELLIVNTILLSLHKECKCLSDKDDILNKINTCISNIYENNDLNELLENSKTFNDSIRHIDGMYDRIREQYQKNKCYRSFYRLNDMFNYFLKHSIIICKVIHETNMIVIGMDDSSDEDDDDDDDDVVEEVSSEDIVEDKVVSSEDEDIDIINIKED